jgi:hypothetical protein
MAYGYVVVLLTIMTCSVLFMKGHILSPVKIVTMMLAYMYCTDFAIRGMNDASMFYMSELNSEFWSMFLLIYTTIAWLLILFLDKLNFTEIRNVTFIADLSVRSKLVLSALSSAVVLVNLYNRIYLSGSLSEFWLNMLAPRGSAVWLVMQSQWMPGYATSTLLDIATPIATGILLHVTLRARPWDVPIPLLIMLIGYILIIANGSRTELIEAYFIGSAYSLFQPSRTTPKLVISGVAVLLLILFVTVYRAEGIGSVFLSSGIELQYHQDDNFYTTIRALRASVTEKRGWDAATFMLTCFTNPIPRSLWSAKPLLDQSFFGSYKEFWITITSLGELAACFGAAAAVVINTIIVGIIFLFLNRKYSKVSSFFDLFVYASAVLWCYMILRSLQNITQFIYPYVAAELLRVLVKRRVSIPVLTH